MRREPGPDEVDVTAPDEVVTAMSAAVERLRQLAAEAFSASSTATPKATAAPAGPDR
ncbi:MAG TPA: hypothetical protein VGO87_10880 [Acidimicrobiia bacterium]|jgi:hypothetical protein